MIEIDDKAIQQYVYFPKNSNVEADSFDLVLNSQVTQLDYEFTGLTDESRTKNYYKFYLDASQMNDGEYNYSIKANGEVVATGIIKIGEVGDDVPDRYNYNPFSDEQSDNEIVQYYPTGNYKYRFQNNKLIEVTENGVYNVKPDSGYTALLNVEVHANIQSGAVINNQTKFVRLYDNGSSAITYDSGYTGLEKVNVEVEVPVMEYYQSGYTSGYTDGFNTGYTSGCTDGYQEGYGDGFTTGYTSGMTEQKAKLVSTAVTLNGTYSREDGYSSITVNVSSGATINNQTKSITATTNGVSAITFDEGYTGLDRVDVNVNVPTQDYWNMGFASGYTLGTADGAAEQKAKMTSIVIDGNGTFRRENGYKEVIVQVPQSGYTQEDLDNAYASGYTSGVTDGVAEQKAKLISTAITGNGTYQRNDGFETVTVSVPTIKYHSLQIVPQSTVSSGLTNRMQATVTQLGSATTKTYIGDGYAMAFELLPGAEYTVTYNNVEGYNTPSPQETSGVTTWSGRTFLMPWYEVSSGVPYEDQYLTLEIVSGGTLVGPYMNYQTSKIYYSINNGEWLQISDTTPINVSTGDKVRLKGKNQSVAVAASKSGFNGTSKYNLCGNIMSILYNDDFQNQTTLSGTNSFSRVFKNSQVIDAENLILPATTLTQACYQGMFSGCTTIVTAPSSLPAMTLTDACYDSMFRGCTSLVTAPALPATNIEINCYQYMFVGCSNLVNVPSVLPATTLKNYCYQNMFGDCTSLTTAPELPATALTHYCYNAMFFGCTSLNYIKCLAVNGINLNNSTSSWVFEVPSGGIFVKSVNAIDWPTTGDNGIPNGWTVEEV